MAKIYTKNTWIDESLAGIDRYDILTDGGTPIESNVQINLITPVAIAGTPLNDTFMNNIETGIDTLDTMLAIPGWLPTPGTFTYSSLDAPIGILSANTDLTEILSRGMRLRYSQVQSLTVYWSFDTNSNSQVGTHNGTDTAMTYTAGKFSNAATFNGTTSKINVADHANLKPTGEFTVGCWFKTSNTGAEKVLFQSFSANTAFAGFILRISSTNFLEILVGKNTGTTPADYSLYTGKTTVTDNVMHYVVLSFRNNYLQIYLDGNLEIYGYSVAPAYAATNYVRIGCKTLTGSDVSFMNGQIDDLFLINGYALDERTIREKYRTSTAQGTSSLTLIKHGIIYDVGQYSGGATLVTIYSGTDFTPINSTITSVYHSPHAAPFGFNRIESKWSGTITDNIIRTQASPANGVIYNPGSLSISVPLGAWKLSYDVIGQAVYNASSILVFGIKCALSTSASAFSHPNLISEIAASLPIVTTATIRNHLSREKIITLAAKTTFYLVIQANQAAGTSLDFRGDSINTILKYESAYL